MDPKKTCGDKDCTYDTDNGWWACKDAAGKTGMAYDLDANVQCDAIVQKLVFSRASRVFPPVVVRSSRHR